SDYYSSVRASPESVRASPEGRSARSLVICYVRGHVPSVRRHVPSVRGHVAGGGGGPAALAHPGDLARLRRRTAAHTVLPGRSVRAEFPAHAGPAGDEAAGASRARLLMHGALVIGMTGQLELEGRMIDVEVAAQALLESVEHDRAPAVGEHVAIHDDVHRQDGQPRRDGPYVQVVHFTHAGQAGQVRPDLA